jgi:hypothetical protein
LPEGSKHEFANSAPVTKIFESQIILKSLGTRKPKELNRIAKFG